MWPFKKSQHPTLPADQISFSQLDITEDFGDDARLEPDDWIATVPLNTMVPNPETSGLPAVGAADDDVFKVASRLSFIREFIGARGDGVYCPVCHIANTQAAKLRTPCPHCGRALLMFGWD
jgi:hypothetical protein